MPGLGFNWLEREPALKGKVKDQQSRLLAFVIGARYLIKQIHKTRDWMLSTQDLVDNLIRFYGDEIPTNDDGSIIIGPHNTYPARMSTALKYCIHQGLAFESDYPYTGTRDTSDLPKPIKRRRIYIRGFKELGCSTDGPEAIQKILEFLAGGPLIGTVLPNDEFENWVGDKIIETMEEVGLKSYSTDISSTIIDDSSADKSGVVEHAVAIVALYREESYYLIQNSYSVKWAVKGIAKIRCHLVYDIIAPLDPSPTRHVTSLSDSAQKREEKRGTQESSKRRRKSYTSAGSKALECDVRLTFFRRSLFANAATQLKYLSHLIIGTKDILHTWKELWAPLARDVPFSAICWGTLKPTGRTLLGMVGEESNVLGVHGTNFCAGTLAAAAFAVEATNPLDVAETRRQIEKDPARALVITTGQTLGEILRDGGMKGFFAGVGPCDSVVGPSGTVVSFYEVVGYIHSASSICNLMIEGGRKMSVHIQSC